MLESRHGDQIVLVTRYLANYHLGFSLANMHNVAIPAGTRALFPLKLTPFEQMMVVDDRPDYPMIAQLELVFSGPFDTDRISKTIRRVLQNHPLMVATLKKSFFGLRWIIDSDQPKVQVECINGKKDNTQKAIDELKRSFDLFNGGGIKFLLVETKPGFRLHILLHHACADGIGLFHFVEDLLIDLHNSSRPSSGLLEKIDRKSELLSRRGKHPVKSKNWRSLISETAFGFKLAARFGKHKPNPIVAPSRVEEQFLDDGIGDANPYEGLNRSFADLLLPIRRAAAAQGVTLNDLLIKAMFNVVNDWNQLHSDSGNDHKHETERYRIMMPCNLRATEQQLTSAANIMSFSFLDRQVSDLADPDELLQGISSETKYIRTQNASLYFIRSLQVARRIPFGIKQVSRADQCMATAVVSNIGDPVQLFQTSFQRVSRKILAGDWILQEIHAKPPLRPLTRIGMVVNTYANELSVGLEYDRNNFTLNEVTEFVNLMRKYLPHAH